MFKSLNSIFRPYISPNKINNIRKKDSKKGRGMKVGRRRRKQKRNIRILDQRRHIRAIEWIKSSYKIIIIKERFEYLLILIEYLKSLLE